MCTQKPPHDYSDELYQRYKQSFERYIAEKVVCGSGLQLWGLGEWEEDCWGKLM